MNQQSNGINIVIQGVFNTFLYFIIEHNFIAFTTNPVRINLNHLRQYNPNNAISPPIQTTRTSSIGSTNNPQVSLTCSHIRPANNPLLLSN